jgi:hypothetical protein
MRSVLFVSVAPLVAILALAACVDGKTPDCSDPASQCAPDLDGTVPDGLSDAPVVDAPADAPVDSTTDAGQDAPTADANDAGDARG